MGRAYTMLDAHPMTIIIVVAAMMVTPAHLIATYTLSGADTRRALPLAAAFLLFGAAMTWLCLADIPARLGLAGNLIIPIAWIAPSALILLFRDRVLPPKDQPQLSQHWLVGLQVWRAIGGVFLIEMTKGHIPPVFAWPAGLGDIAVAALAAYALIISRNRPIPTTLVYAVIVLGVADFLSAFFFGFTSGETPLQLFYPEEPSRILEFPTGMIPLFLVPYAIAFHTLSWLTLRRTSSTPTAP